MKRAVLTTIALLAALYAIVVTWKKNERAAGLDFYLYYVNSQLPSRADVDNIYSPETQERIGEEYYARAQASSSELRKYDATRRRRLDNVSSPFLYTTLRWVSRDYDRALLQDHALLLIAVVVFIARVVLREWHRLRIEILGGAIGVAIAIVVTAINYGTFRVWLQWNTAANEFFHRLRTRDERNVAPALSLFQQHGTWLGYVIAALLIAIVCYGLVRASGAPSAGRGAPEARTTRRDALLVGLAILIYLISAPVVWLHYMVLSLPLAIALLRCRWTAIVSLLALAVIAEVPFEWITRTPVYPHDATLITPALLALFACGVWALSKRDEAAA